MPSPSADRLLKQDPKNSLAHLAEGIRAMKAKQFSTARNELSQGTSNRQRDISATLLIAWAYAGAGDEKRALEATDSISDPRFKVFRDYHAGLIADLFDDTPEAAKRLKSAYDSEKTTLRVVDAYARFIDRHDDPDGAKQAYHDFDALLPHHPLVMAALADLDAGHKLDPLVKSAEAGAAEVLYGLGAVGSQANDDLASMIYLRLALYLAPDNGLALVTLADTYERQNQGERAIDIYQSVPEKSPLRPNSDIQAALILDTLGNSEEATKRLQDIVAARPKDTDALLALGNLQRSHKQFEEATASYTKVLDAYGCRRQIELVDLLFPRHLRGAQQALAGRRSRFQEGARTVARSAARLELSRLFLGRQGHSISTKRSRCCAVPSNCGRPTAMSSIVSAGPISSSASMIRRLRSLRKRST